MGKFVKTSKIDKAFYKSADFKRIVRVGAAAFEPRLTGGFERLINQQQGNWAPLNLQYQRWKERKGLDRRKWVRTGRTLAAMRSGKPEKEGTRKGVRYKVTPGRFLAIVRVSTFRSSGKGRKPGGKVQKKIFKNLNYGIDVARKAQKKGRAVKSKTGRVLSGFPARPLFEWYAGETQEIRKSIEAEVREIFKELGFNAR